MPVEFENDYKPSAGQYAGMPQFANQGEVKGMAGWLIKKGIIKNESQAGAVLILIFLLNLGLSIAVFYYFVF